MDLPVRNINGFDHEVVEEPFHQFDPGGPGRQFGFVRVRVGLN